ncbi:hypothetical protein [Brenneria roseae]|uniref:hypothetical protein n=1 Tax=Brenneria roseae TaxID=1509241 RepID=UPI003CD0D4F1
MLEETFGIQEFKLYSYLECYCENQKQALYHKGRNTVIGSFNLKSHDNLENTAKLISKDGNNRIISFDKKLDVDKILTTVENIQANNPYQFLSDNIRAVPASVIKSLIHEEHLRKQSEKNRLILGHVNYITLSIKIKLKHGIN